MVRKSVSVQLKDFLSTNRGIYNSGELQKMVWVNRDGTHATGKTVSRRLQELAESKEINVDHSKGSAEYSADPIIVPPKPMKFVVIDGERVLV